MSTSGGAGRRGRDDPAPARRNDLASEVGWGDLIEARVRLDPSPDELRRIAEFLGLRERAAPPAPAPVAATATADVTARGGAAQTGAAVEDTPIASPTLAARRTDIPPRPDAAARPAWFGTTDAMAAPSAKPADPSVPPLFEPRWTRAILSAALSTPVAEGQLDMPRVVEHLARAWPFARLPRALVPTTRRGSQVLIDRGDGMQPFRADLVDLASRIGAVIGRPRAGERWFIRTPTLDPDEADLEPADRFAFPRRGTPVAILTDFGIGASGDLHRASTDDWLVFTSAARQARVPLVAFVPYPVARVPSAIRRQVTVIPWDRTTTIRDVHRATRGVIRVTV